MDYKKINYRDVGKEQWNSCITQITQASYFHCWQWLDYCQNFQNVVDNISFIIIGDDATPLAVCPLFLSEIDGLKEISINGAPVGTPGLSDNLKPSAHRKMLDRIFSIINDYAIADNAERIIMATHPLTQDVCGNNTSGFRNTFELLRYRMLYRVENTLIIDLNLPEETLSGNLSKDRRWHINKAGKYIKVVVFNCNKNTDKLRDYFTKFQKAHFESAGRITRPQTTWDSMYQTALDGKASLFISFLDNCPISYLFCGEFASMAFGWSQVNIKQYEKEYSPRHLLEWEAILYYKRRGFRYYEVGERYYCPQPLYIPSTKELTISRFKEHYSGFMLPKIYWLGYLNKDRMDNEIREHYNNYLVNDNLVKAGKEDYLL